MGWGCAHLSTHTHGGQQRALGIPLYHFLLSSLEKGQVCGGSNEDDLHRLISLSSWSPAGELLKRLSSVDFLEKVCYWGGL